jgi:hypothetical protein
MGETIIAYKNVMENMREEIIRRSRHRWKNYNESNNTELVNMALRLVF